MNQGPYPPQGNFGQPQWGGPQGPQGPQWGGPPGPQGPQWGSPAGPPPKSGGGILKILGIGCLVIIALSCIGAAIAGFALKDGIFGKVTASADLQPNTPFAMNFTQNNSEDHQIWIDLDVSQNTGPMTGSIQVSANGQAIAQYPLNFQSRASCFNPAGGNTSGCINYSSSGTALSGRLKLFTIPAQANGAAVSVTGVLMAPQGLVSRRLQLQSRE